MPLYKIAGVLKLTSPLHVASPGDRVINLESLRLSYGKADNDHMNLTGTTHCPLALTEDEMLNEGIEPTSGDPTESAKSSPERGIVHMPIFPANDARGRLRRHAAAEIFNLLRSRGEMVSLPTFHAITCGAATGELNKDATLDLILESGKHAFLGLFGGGPRMVDSSLKVHTLWPITSTTIKAELVPMRYEDRKVPSGANRLTRAMFYRRIDDALVFSTGLTELVVKEYSSAVADWIVELGSAKSEDGTKIRSAKQLHTFGAVEFVIPGTRLYSEIKVDTERVGLGALGLLIHAVAGFANKQGIGGWSRIGFGNFESEFELLTPANGRVPLLTKSESGYEPNADADEIAEALDAWAAASTTVTALELERLYALPSAKMPSAKKKKEKASA